MPAISRYTPDDVDTWYQARERQIFLGDVVDSDDDVAMGVGFARYAPGESNAWVVTYDEVLVVTKGTFTVTSADGHGTTAGVGELIYLRKDTELVYSTGDTGAELVYVTYPLWMDAQQRSPHAALLDAFHPADVAQRLPEAAASSNVALLRRIWDPLERGESDDFQPFMDALADDVVFELPVGDLDGKRAVADYFTHAAGLVEFHPFEKPLEYYGDGSRVVIVGAETFRVKDTGVAHSAEWAWVVHFHDGLISRIVHIQDLTDVADTIREAVSRSAKQEDIAV
ncbi:SnoaL-like protein [Herbihabitans rhizosphaerae]|uniref:SnoaL-like protein n=1 Tax=Herbihabitans rhizosphaerae TaxID=1872711 RepID=A0A4V2ERT6_9PSEU|nr:nuclear transport factor 2 family protein [Herbihabitans rhizosphaerae]RZS33997.1 SnoaL-like protein [Herbihabitans rhizosphaerae]